MFDIGFWELILICVVALVVLGPERLPHAIRTVAKFVATARRMATNVRDEISQELKLQELQENMDKLREKQQTIHRSVTEAVEGDPSDGKNLDPHETLDSALNEQKHAASDAIEAASESLHHDLPSAVDDAATVMQASAAQEATSSETPVSRKD